MSLLRQWKGWSHLFRSSLFGLLRSWLANFERLQVIDLMEKVTKEQSKEATKSNGSFLGSWSWVIEPMIGGGLIRFLMTSQNKMVGISCQFKSFVVMSSVRLSEIWILMVHNARKPHIWTLNYHMLVFGHCVSFNLSMCIWKEYCEAARSVSEDRTKSSVYGGHGHKTPVSGSLLQSATIIFFSALSLQKDNPTLALCTLS